MTYEERVKQLAEEMYKQAAKIMEVGIEHSGEKQKSISVLFEPLARIAVKHMSEEFTKGVIASLPDYHRNSDHQARCRTVLLNEGLIPSPAEQAQNNVE